VNRRSESESGPRSLRDRIRETTEQAILEAAEARFAEAGVHAARMDEIAAVAGVSVGTLYNHFRDRDALLAGLVEERRSRLIGAIDAAVAAGAGQPFRERLRALVVALLTHCEQHRKFLQIVLQREVGGAERAFHPRAKSADTMNELLGRIEKVMKHGLREKALRADTADLAAMLLLGMIRALVIRELVLGREQGLVGEAERIVGVFLDGLGERDLREARA
jgi:AcrR family transcriptional regulator